MGGGSLRRIVVDGTTTAKTVIATNNVMYESFGNNTFTMPDPDTVPVGTRIGFEQFVGTGRVNSIDNSETFTQVLEPDIPDGDYDSQPASNAVSYIFECVLGKNGTKREWMLDIDHNYAAAITTIVDKTEAISKRVQTVEEGVTSLKSRASALETRAGNLETRAGDLETRATNLETKDTTHDQQITALQTRASNLESRATALETKSTNIHNEFVQNYRTAVARTTKYVTWGSQISSISNVHPTTAQLNDPAQMKTFLTNNPYTIAFYDLIISLRTNNSTITLPTPSSAINVGTTITINLYPGYTCTVKDGVNTETFTADASSILVLEFEFNNIPPGGTNDLGWALLSLA